MTLKLERYGKIEKEFLIFLEKKQQELSITDFVTHFNLHASTTKRILFALERKNKIRFIEQKVLLIQNFNNLNFSKKNNIYIYHDSLKTQRYFKANDENILIQTSFTYFELLRQKILYNESLQNIKAKNEIKFTRLVNSAFEQINYDLINLAKRINTWSNNKYEILLVEEVVKIRDIKYKMPILKLVHCKSKEVVLFNKNFRNIKEQSILCECIDLIIKTLKRTQNNINYLAYFDYSNH